MRKALLSLVLLGSTIGTIGATQLGAQAENWEPKRINKVIELWEMGEPVYYTGCGACDYEAGLRLAQTTADYIDYGMEHSSSNIDKLRDFMRGLVEGGPTPSGHRTPAVIVSTPAIGWSETAMRANTHFIQYLLAAGVHGVLLTHAVDPAAIRIMNEAMRYPFAPPAAGLGQGMRGSGSSGFAAGIWGIPGNEYLQRADLWPLNPNGEIVVGLKIENIHAVEMSEFTAAVPGVAFAEWGPGDNAYWLGHALGLGAPAPNTHPQMQQLRERVFNAVRANNGFFLNSCNASNVTAMIDEGVMICTGGGSQETVEAGRRHTNRQMPW